MWDLLHNIGGTLALAVLLLGIFLGSKLLGMAIGPQAGAILGLLVSAYPAYLVFRKFG